MLRFLGLLVLAVFQTLASRLRRGPLRPGWAFGFEVIVRTLRADWEALWRWPVPVGRAALEARRFPSEVAAAVTRTEVRDGPVAGEWVRPHEAAPRSDGVVLYLHGGSYLYGSPRTHADTIARVALASGREVFALEYRLAPEHPYPAQRDDALACLAWLEAQGIARSRVVLAGESAGGNLVLATLLALRDAGSGTVAGGVMVSPWLDLTASSDAYTRNADCDYGTREMLLAQAKMFAGDVPVDDPRVSVGRAPPEGIAPVLVQAGTAEMLYDECHAWADTARAAGVDVTFDAPREMPHAPPFFAAQSPEGRRAVDAIGAFVRGRLG